ncbi:MAG TPA: 2-dehydro-3-deoxyglucarate aldolase [Verrucomicrobiales bacterium]|nr:2-dehydro-3-deoxyglucarate aldolase [Verrucomicrobiales bacterium]
MNTAPLQLGTWISTGSAAVTELAALCGLDWVLLDLEHGCESEAAIPGQLRPLRGGKTRGIVRVGAPHADLIGRVLDWGADGVMVPHVESAAAAEAIVRAAHHAPRGQRGFARTVRACDYGLRPAEEKALPLLMAQIETITGVGHCADIAAVEGIDVLFVGPADLQHDLRSRPERAPGDYARCLEIVNEAARAAGKQTGILLRDPAEVPRYRDLGFTHIAVDSDLSILRKAWRQTVEAAEGG